jgi:hypothetical protein
MEQMLRAEERQARAMEEIAREIFPLAQIHRHKMNLGIARNFDFLERKAFNLPHSEWVFFQEDDFELGPIYLEVLSDLVNRYGDNKEIVEFSATGDSLIHNPTAHDFLPMNHRWSYLLRKSHHEERKPLWEKYLLLLGKTAYFRRNNEQIVKELRSDNIFPVASSQDYIKQALRRHFHRVSLTTSEHYGRYIGRTGEHFTEEFFNAMGYADIQVVEKNATVDYVWDVATRLKFIDFDDNAYHQELLDIWLSRYDSLLASHDSRQLHIEKLEIEIEKLRDVLQEQSTAISDLEVQLNDSLSIAKTLDCALRDSHVIRSRLERDLEHAHGIRSRLERDLEHAHGTLNVHINSLSWKLTRPLRSINRIRRDLFKRKI